VLTALAVAQLPAQTTNSWNRNASASWQTATNWLPATVPNGSGSVAVFGPSPTLLSNNCIVGTTFTAARTITNTSIITLGGIVIGTNSSNVIINNDAGQITFDGPDTTTFINIDAANTAGNNQIDGPLGALQIVDRLRIHHLGSGTLTIEGPISSIGGGAGLTIAGTGQVNLLAGAAGITPSTFTGSVNLEGGTLRVDADGGLGNTANAVNFTNNAVLFVRTNFFVNASRVFNFFGDGTLNITNVSGGGFRFGNTAGRLAGPGTLTKEGAGSLVLGNQANANFRGAVLLNRGTIVATNIAALGTNQNITVAGGAKLDIINGVATNNANTTNVYTVASGGLIGGNTAFLASLTRGSSLFISSNAIIFQRQTNGNNSVANLGTGADLFFGLGANLSNSITVSDTPGTTPWKGISTDGSGRSLTNSTITAAGNFYLQGANITNDTDSILTLGDNFPIAGTIRIVKTAPTTLVTGYVATVTVGNTNGGAVAGNTVRLNETDAEFGNVVFEVQNGAVLGLRTGTALGGSGANNPATKAIVDVLSGGTLSVDAVSNTVDAINSDVTIRAGGALNIAAQDSTGAPTGLAGSGTITLQPGALVGLNNAQALSGSQFTPASINSSHIVRLSASEIANLSMVDPGATYMVNATVTNSTETIELDGGLLTVNQGNSRTLAAGAGINIGASGATFGGVLQNGASVRELIILCPVTASGPLFIGTTNVLAFDGQPRSGRVRFGNLTSTALSVIPGGDFRWQAGELRFSGKGNSDAFVAGTLLTNIVIPPTNGQFLIDLSGTNEILVAAQRIVLSQVLRTNSLRNIFVGSNDTSTAITLICTNLIAPNGSVLAVDESGGVSFIAGVTLQGAEFRVTDGPDSDDIDFAFFRNPSGLPRSVIMGAASDGSDNIMSGFVAGDIGDNITFEQLWGLLTVSNSVTLGTNIVINNLGTNYTHPVHGQYIDGGANIHIGRDGSDSSQSSRLTVNLGSGQDINLFVDEVASNAVPITNVFFGRVNILTNQLGVLASGVGINTDLVSTVVFDNVHAYTGSTIQMTAGTETNILGTLTLVNGPVSLFAGTATQLRQMVRNINMNGHTLTVGGINRIQLIGTASGGGAIVVTNVLITNSVVINTNCILTTNDIVSTNGARFGGHGTITGSLVVSDAARLEPGFQNIGTMTVNGNVTLASGATNVFGIAGNTVGTFAQLSVGGTANLNGALSLDLLGGYFPATSNDVLTIVTAGTRAGTYANAPGGSRVDIVAVGTNIGSYRVTYTGTQVRLDNWQYTTSDADADGITDSWAVRYFGVVSLPAGTGPGQRDGDDDGDGVSNIGEFLAGTDPLNPASTFKITAINAGPGNSATVQWVNNDNPMHHTSVYTVQYTDVLGTAYTNVVGATITFPSPGVAQWIDNGTLTGGTPPLSLPSGRRHYRIQAQ
jgi:autotransporter-associated beta strand protein